MPFPSTPPTPAGKQRKRRVYGERCAACLILIALLLAQSAALTGHAPRLGPALNGVRRAASLLSRKLHDGEYRLGSRRPAAHCA